MQADILFTLGSNIITNVVTNTINAIWHESRSKQKRMKVLAEEIGYYLRRLPKLGEPIDNSDIKFVEMNIEIMTKSVYLSEGLTGIEYLAYWKRIDWANVTPSEVGYIVEFLDGIWGQLESRMGKGG